MNNTTTNANGSSGASSDFIDFYQLLGADQESTTTALRRRINDLYTEAQSNRDHRNPTKRRRYEALCELLPYCRIVLLDPDKRVRYDRYREQFQAGTTVPSFENMMDEIAGRVDDALSGSTNEKIGLLGVEGDDDYLPVTPGSTARGSRNAPLERETHAHDAAPRRAGLFDKPSPRAAATRSGNSAVEPAFSDVSPTANIAGNASYSAPQKPDESSNMAPHSPAGLTPLAYSVVAVIVGTLATRVLLSGWPLERALLVGIILGIATYFITTSMTMGNSSKRRNRM